MEALIKLLPVVIGGVLALSGGIVGQLMAHRLKASADRKAKRLAKFEEMLICLIEHSTWLDNKKDVVAFGSDRALTAQPLHSARAICAMYFPEFMPRIQSLEVASSSYQVVLAEAGVKRVNGQISEMTDGFQEAYSSYLKTHDDVLDELAKHAARAFSG